METALAVRKQLTPDVWQMITHVAPMFKDSRLFGVATESQAAAVMAKGYELGLPLTASFEFITVIDNKPTLVPRGALALIYQSGELEKLTIDDDGKTCTVTMKRHNGPEFSASFSMDDAKAAGLVKTGSGWEKYPRQMRQWRAVGFCADMVFPDVLGGLKRADELGADLSPDGDVIEATWTAVPNAEPEKPAPTTTSAERLNELVNAHGADAIITANDGKIPATIEECEAVAAKLNGGE